MGPIHYIPDNPGDVSPITIAPANLFDNDVRLDRYQRDRIEHTGLFANEITESGSSSTGVTGATFYDGEGQHPIAFTAVVSPDVLFVNDAEQPFYSGMPGDMHGPAMTNENYLTYPGASEDIPGSDLASSSAI